MERPRSPENSAATAMNLELQPPSVPPVAAAAMLAEEREGIGVV